jgi:hypothetical protein
VKIHQNDIVGDITKESIYLKKAEIEDKEISS